MEKTVNRMFCIGIYIHIESKTENGVTTDYTYSSVSGWNKLLTGVQVGNTAKTISYDSIGNPTSYLGASLTWFGRQLTSYTKDNVTYSFKYDADGLRASKTKGDVTTTYQYVGDKLYYEKRGNDELYFFYDSYGQLSAINHNGTNYYTATNSAGDVVAIYLSTGALLVQYEYDAWGKCIAITDSLGNEISSGTHIANINPIRYRGYYYDSDLGLYYLQSRYYNPEIGRFINADGVIDNRGVITQNLFQYCGNNPVNNADPSGNLFGAIVGIGLLVIGIVATLSGCSSKPAATPSKPSTSSSSSSSSTSPHIPTPQEKSYAATVYAEAGGQNKRSKQAVAHVMNNRIGTRSSWTDIESVISAEYQFDGYNSPMYKAAMNYYDNGICNNSIEQAAMDECLAVVIPIYSGAEADITDGALYFHSFPNPSDWVYHNSYTQVYVSETEKFWFYK